MRRLIFRPVGREVKMGVPPNWPMILVSWYGANAYALWAARLMSHHQIGNPKSANLIELSPTTKCLKGIIMNHP